MRLISDHLGRAFELLRLERYDLALQEVHEALAKDPNSAEAHICGASVLRAQGRLGRAEEASRAALVATPRLAAAHHIRALVLYDIGWLIEADAAFKMLRSLPDAHQPQYLISYAHFLAATGRYGNGLPIIEQALKLSPESADAHTIRGTLLLRLKRYDAAVDAILAPPISAIASSAW